MQFSTARIFQPLGIRQRIIPYSGADQTVTAFLARTIDITSEPDGANVFVNGTLRAKTPKYELKVPEGSAFTLRVEKPGFSPWIEKLRYPRGSKPKAR